MEKLSLLLLIKIHSLIIFKPTSLLQLHAGCVLDNGCVSNALNKGFISSMYSALYRVEIKKKKTCRVPWRIDQVHYKGYEIIVLKVKLHPEDLHIQD